MLKESTMGKVRPMVEYFSKLNGSIQQLEFDLNRFSSPGKLYALTADINTVKTDLARTRELLTRINKDLLKDGVCIIEPVVKLEIKHESSTGKQKAGTKRRSTKLAK